MKYYAVIDTNVLVSAMLKWNSIPGHVMELVFEGPIVPLLDERIVTEYREVLARPKFHLTEDIIEDVLENIERNGIYVDAKPLDVELPDSKDMMFYEVVMEERSMPSRARGEAACAENSYLVTGNIKHFPVERFIVTPREMMDIILADTEGGNRVIN